jgi:hypothetical protein
MLKRSCLALAAAVLSLVPSLPVFAQSALTNQDIEYLAFSPEAPRHTCTQVGVGWIGGLL